MEKRPLARGTGIEFAVGLLVVAGLGVGLRTIVHAQAGARGATDRLVPTGIQGRITPAFRPPGLDPDERVTVVATMAGEPVALAQETASRRLTRAEKDRIKGQRRGEQTSVRPSLEALGADVVGSYQSALNGIKVRIPRRQLGALRQIPGVVSVKPVTMYMPPTSSVFHESRHRSHGTSPRVFTATGSGSR